MRRISIRRAGHDCRVTCSHERKGDHGICSDEWTYLIEEYGFAFGIKVFSFVYPASVNVETLSYRPEAPLASCEWHSLEPRETNWAHSDGCEVFQGKRCFFEGGNYGLADRLVLDGKLNPLDFGQAEGFWLVLENEFKRQLELRPVVKEIEDVCPHCKGSGNVLIPWRPA